MTGQRWDGTLMRVNRSRKGIRSEIACVGKAYELELCAFFFFFSSRRRHTRLQGDWSSDVCSSDLQRPAALLETAGTLFQATESLLDHLLAPLDLAATARGVLLEGLARGHQLFLRREHDTLSGFPEQPFGLHRGRARRRLRRSALHAAADQVEQHPCSDASAQEG